MSNRRVANRAKLAEAQQIVLPDDVLVIRYGEIAKYCTEGNWGVHTAAEHFKCSTGQVRTALAANGVKAAKRQTLWETPDSEVAE